uniref:Putative secreted protein n=1 Tax=Amblyomma tuberculatum TaxID=48802 RepID=A0A6M2E2T5_9ACAR
MKLILVLKLAIVLLIFRLSEGNESIQGFSNFDDQLDILQVLNTSEKLWLYKESHNNWRSTRRQENNINLSYNCLNVHKISLSASQYNFTEQFKDPQEWWKQNGAYDAPVYRNRELCLQRILRVFASCTYH